MMKYYVHTFKPLLQMEKERMQKFKKIKKMDQPSQIKKNQRTIDTGLYSNTRNQKLLLAPLNLLPDKIERMA